MLYGDLVAASQRTAATSKRSEKVGALAELLRGTASDEVEAAIGLLVGEPRQRPDQIRPPPANARFRGWLQWKARGRRVNGNGR